MPERTTEPNEELFLDLLKELKSYARFAMRNQNVKHTLQPTALLHEFYLKLRSAEKVRFQDAEHFLRCAAKMMRQILVDHARKKGSLKRTLVEEQFGSFWATSEIDMLALNEALEELAKVDLESTRVAEIRYYLGATTFEAAQALGMSTRTVERKWAFAKAYLRDKLK